MAASPNFVVDAQLENDLCYTNRQIETRSEESSTRVAIPDRDCSRN